MTRTRSVGILLFEDVEVLDVAGPFEVFSLTGLGQNPKPFEVFTVAESSPIRARNGLGFFPNYKLSDAPDFDILILTGGPGARKEIFNQSLIQWIQERAPRAELILSVCTGAFFLAKAGLVDGMPLTTHHLAFEELKAIAPDNPLKPGERIIDNGRIIVSAGVSSGIDMSFYVVAKLLGEKVAQETAEQIEYPWNPDLKIS